ncbi:MAG: amidophosphoribosyltransferase [Firmicutes bacterium]|nr:amidophosphoribosyltransferase [Bacillota bacterium]
MNREIHEACGLFGIFAPERQELARSVYYGLYALQHRGQQTCGIAVNDDGVINWIKNEGLVNDVFTTEMLDKLGLGNMAVGHTLYGTKDANYRLNAQPMVVNHIKGNMAVCHNGSLVNAYELRRELELQGSIFHTTSDAEVIAYTITQERLRTSSVEEALCEAMHKLDGAYSLVIMSPSKLIAARDPHGFRPLCYGITEDGCYIVASETCGLDSVGATYIRDLEPGEIVIFDKDGIRTMREHCGTAPKKLCIFEYIYFARPDSVIEGISVHEARLQAGAWLAKQQKIDADVVIGVPDSGIDAAIGYAKESGIPYGLGFIKNKYIGRTFIAPGQAHREDKVRIKLNPVSSTVRGKRVVLVDDSIVRGTTMARIVKLLREAGATEVHVRSSAPKFLNPCHYGTDIDSRDALIACNHTTEEIKNIIGADSLDFLELENLPNIIGAYPERGYCDACFSGKYPTKEPVAIEKSRYEHKISEKKEAK